MSETKEAAERYRNWRSDQTPQFQMQRIKVNVPEDLGAQTAAITEYCISQYHKATDLMEHSISEVALAYSHKDGDPNNSEDGILLEFAKKYSNRYLDLYKAYVQMEIDVGIPMISLQAGKMKMHGFKSQEIIDMIPSCKDFIKISKEILSIFNNNTALYDKFISIMTNEKLRTAFLSRRGNGEKIIDSLKLGTEDKEIKKLLRTISPKELIKIENLTRSYMNLKHSKQLDRAHFMMHNFAHMSYTDVALQLEAVGDLDYERLSDRNRKPIESLEERLRMEIRHRIAGDSTVIQNSLGTLGGNPLSYLNMLEKGEGGNKEAEFRERLYFVYMSNHFANAIMENDETVNHINQWLKANGKTWELDKEFIDYLKERKPKYIPPIFRYGAYAALNNPHLREPNDSEEVSDYYSRHPNPSISSVMEKMAGVNAHYNLILSSRELLNQTGEPTWDAQDKNPGQRSLNFGTGAAVFRLETDTNKITKSESAKQYLTIVNELQIPVVAGISGTLDQSTTMAGLVGIGSSTPSFGHRQMELETIRLAYLAFMLPGRDHSVHEIMESSKTFGLQYSPGPGYYKYIFPDGRQGFIDKLEEAQRKRGSELPDYYLTDDYAREAAAGLESRHIEKITVVPDHFSPLFDHTQQANAHTQSSAQKDFTITSTSTTPTKSAEDQKKPKHPSK